MTLPMLSRSVVAIAVAMALVACGDRQPQATSDTAAPAAGAPGHTAVTTDDAELAREVRSYQLTMPRIEQYVRAVQNLQQLERTDPALQRRINEIAEGEDRTLSEMTTIIEGEPRLRDAITSTGLSTRDYMLISFALMQSMMAHEFQRQGYIQELPPDVNPQNVAFVRENEARLQPLLEQLQGEEP